MKKPFPLKLAAIPLAIALMLFGVTMTQDWIAWKNHEEAMAAFTKNGVPFSRVSTPSAFTPDFIEAPNIRQIGRPRLPHKTLSKTSERWLDTILTQARTHTLSTAELNLKGPHVTDSIVTELATKMWIYKLYLVDTKITDTGLLSLTNSVGLTELRLVVSQDTISTNTLTTLTNSGINVSYTVTP